MIRICEVRIGAEEEALVLEVLRSGQLAQGPMVGRFEATFATLVGVEHAVAVSSGTTALALALRAHGIGPGDEVIASPFTFVATVNAILDVGATARFADVDDTYTVDPASVAALVNDRTAALLPVHLYGLPADLTALGDIAERHGLAVIEDAAQAHGAAPAGRAGTACWSFYATKNLTTGEGGMVTTADGEVAERLRLLRNQGMRERYRYEVVGTNARMTDLQAAVGVGQLGRVDALAAARGANAARLGAGLAGVAGITLPTVPEARSHAWHQYVIAVADGRRDALAAALAEAGVETAVHYPRLAHDHPGHRGDGRVVLDPTPRALALCGDVLSLPVHPHLTSADVDRIVDVTAAFFGG